MELGIDRASYAEEGHEADTVKEKYLESSGEIASSVKEGSKESSVKVGRISSVKGWK